MPNQKAENLNLNFLSILLNNLCKFYAQGSDLAPFFGNETKFEISSEIKPLALVHSNPSWEKIECKVHDDLPKRHINQSQPQIREQMSGPEIS